PTRTSLPGTSATFSVPVVYRKLPNGLRVVISENHTAPVVTVEVMYRIGFRIEPRNRTGFAHLFEHLMFQGSEHVNKFEHVRIVNENGGTLNGSTRFDHTNYFELMPSNALELAMWLEADRMRSLKITPENLQNQKDVVSEEVRVNVLNQPYGAFEWLGLPQRANTNWFNAHNFYGDLADIQAATIEDVQKFFDTYYAPNNAVVVVVGDATPDEVVRRRHRVAPAAAAPRHRRAAAIGREEVQRVRQARAHAGARVRLSPARSDDARLLRAVAARSAARQRREREAVSGAHQGESDRLGGFGRLQLRPGQQLRLQRADALYVPRRLPSGSQGRRCAEGGRQGDYRGAGARHQRRRAAAGEGQLPIVVSRKPRGRLRPLRPARGAGALRRRPEPHQHDLDGARQRDDGGGSNRREKISGAGQSHVDRSSSGRRHEVKTLAVCLTALAIASSAAAQAERPAAGPERPFQLAPRVEKTLANGLRVIVTRQDIVPKVSVTLTVRSGYSSDPAILTGLAALTADIVQEGTKTRTSREIRRQFFGMGGSLSAAVSQDYSSLSARGLAEFAPQLIDLVADVAMNPTMPPDELAILKQQRLQNVAQQKASPQFLANREFRRALFGEHPYARTSETEASLRAIDRAKLEEFHREHYRPNNAFLLVVGAVDANAVLTAAEKAFGAWTRGDVPKPTYATPPSIEGRRVYFVQRPNSIQSSIALGNIAVKRSDPRWYELSLANAIYGGAFNSRIVRNIREEKGYTYSPGSILNGFADAGFYRFSADVRNEVTGATLSEVFKEIDKMREEGSEGAELQGAKQYLRGIFPIQTATQAGLSSVLNNVYVFGLPKDYPESYGAKIAAVTAAQVKSAAHTLLGSENSVIAIVGDYAKVKDQLGAFSHITFLDTDGKPISAPTSQP
ncbi:MAG: hypothetical protein DMG00_26340, partial [Acidobacteria bacterium]